MRRGRNQSRRVNEKYCIKKKNEANGTHEVDEESGFLAEPTCLIPKGGTVGPWHHIGREYFGNHGNGHEHGGEEPAEGWVEDKSSPLGSGGNAEFLRGPSKGCGDVPGQNQHPAEGGHKTGKKKTYLFQSSP